MNDVFIFENSFRLSTNNFNWQFRLFDHSELNVVHKETT